MDLEIDPVSATPIYQQIYERIVEAIALGNLRRGESLASVRTLAKAFGINPATVSKAYDLLRAEGFVVTNAKSGTVVATDRSINSADDRFSREWQAELFTLLARARARGMSPSDIQTLTEINLRTLCGAGVLEHDASEVEGSRS